MVMELLVSNLPYTLMGFGLVILAFEALAPGGQFMIPGVALLLTGLTSLVFGGLGVIPLALLVLVYGGVAFYGYKELDLYGGSGQEQTSNITSLQGNTGRVVDTVTTTEGRVKLEDGGFASTYSARAEFGNEIEEGTKIVVTDPGGGNVVTVMELDGDVDEIDKQLEKAKQTKQTVTEDIEAETETN